MRNWRLIEVQVVDAYKAALASEGLAPFVLCGSDVVCIALEKGSRASGCAPRSSDHLKGAGLRVSTQRTYFWARVSE